MYICCVFVGLNNKLYKKHGTYIKFPGVVLKYWYGLINGHKTQEFGAMPNDT